MQGTGCIVYEASLLGTINASALLEQEVPGAEVLYEAGNDTARSAEVRSYAWLNSLDFIP